MNDQWKDDYPLFRRPPRVEIGYDVELYGAEKRILLPFVVGVLADLTGKPGPNDEVTPVEERSFLEIDADNFEERLRSVRPRVAFRVPNTLTSEDEVQLAVEITFESMDDFSPAGVARKIAGLDVLLDERTRLSSLLGYLDGKTVAQDLVEKALYDDAFLMELASLPESKEAGEGHEQAEAGGQAIQATKYLASLYHALNLRSDRAKETVGAAIRTLADAALRYSWVVSENFMETIEGMIAELDRMLTEQINLILHHYDFQAIESTWRGLAYLVYNTETDATLKIRVMDISKRELLKTLNKYKGTAWDQSPIFKKLVEQEYGMVGGEPFACVVGDYYVDNSPFDIELLDGMAQICAAGNMVFLTGTSPALFQMVSWLELPMPRDLSKIFQTPDYAAWRALRETEQARYVGLALPRFLGRLPYGAGTGPGEAFAFEEDMEGWNINRFTWLNAAYAMAFNAGRAFRLYGWCAYICGYETGGAIENLPLYSRPDEQGGWEKVCPTEVNISERREAELASLGICALVHRKGTDFAAFLSTPSLQKPPEYNDPDTTWNARRAADLAFVHTTGQFLRAIRCLKRDRAGSFKEDRDWEVMINRWLNDYVEPNRLVGPVVRARRPLLGAEVKLKEEYSGRGMEVFLMPYYQLERLHSGVPNSISLWLEFPTGLL
jgi:type VI secretion system protein ImpC